ncbi:hypothetical protein BGZ70_001355 [Mortierella alpina]|uniref:O-acyltransferase n=1 Tax=Mortierella alpina TaxID=64518 RepID=A0A9P6JIM7_MORAP|nr:hypothetical protein BGZ70_001355 [Mortierella alpina]
MTKNEPVLAADVAEATLPEIPPTVEDLKKAKNANFSYRHAFPVHTKNIPSPLSKEAPPESYRGLVNLGMLLLFGNNVRLVIENYQKYGVLISMPGSKVSKEDWILTGLSHILLPLNVLLGLQLERWAKKSAMGHRKRLADATAALKNGNMDIKDPKQAFKQVKGIEAAARSSQRLFGWLHALNVILIISWPSYMSYFKIFHPFMSITCLMNATIQFLKMTSFSLVNQDLRAAYIFDLPEDNFHHLTRVHDANSGTTTTQRGEVYQYDVQYPDNITFMNVAYFWFAPTLCYQPSYPRTTVFRKSFFLKRVGEMITCVGMMYFLIEQYATPTLQNSVRAVDQLAFGTMLERVLKLSTTSSVGRYWALWNRPVYVFFKRHVYLPLISGGTSPLTAMFVIFTISAILHEVLIGFPTHMLYGYAFAGMFAQIPLIALTRPLEKWRGTGTGLGNMIFWVSFTILGQPACALLYYYHWTKRHIDDTPSTVA